MSNIKFNKSISVYNYNPFHLSIVTNIKTHALEPCRDETPTMDYLTYDELEYVNSQSDAIKNGLIRFNKDQEKDVYESLEIKDWQNILTNENIHDYLLSPDLTNGLQRIIDIKDEITFERVRCILINLINSGEYDVSNRVMNLVQLRYAEFKKNIRNTKIILEDKNKVQNNTSSVEVATLKEQNKSLQDQMVQLQEMMKQMMSMQGVQKQENIDVKTEFKKAGRPSNK